MNDECPKGPAYTFVVDTFIVGRGFSPGGKT
jgi:hypothetical protein